LGDLHYLASLSGSARLSADYGPSRPPLGRLEASQDVGRERSDRPLEGLGHRFEVIHESTPSLDSHRSHSSGARGLTQNRWHRTRQLLTADSHQASAPRQSVISRSYSAAPVV